MREFIIFPPSTSLVRVFYFGKLLAWSGKYPHQGPNAGRQSPRVCKKIYARLRDLQATPLMHYLNSPEKVADLLKLHLNPRAEELWLLCLDPHGKLLKLEMIFRGTIDMCPSHPREIFRTVICQSSSSFIMVHNHPSGDPTPSAQDLRLTKRIKKLANLFEIPLLDHIILGEDRFVSLRREGTLGRAGPLESQASTPRTKREFF